MAVTLGRTDTAFGDPLRAFEQADPAADDARGSMNIHDILFIYNVNQIAHVAAGDDVVENLKGAQLMSRWLLSSYYFDPFFCTLVILDLIVIAVEVDNAKAYPTLFNALSFFFCFFFAAELAIRIIAAPYSLCKDRLLIFDSFLVSISLLDIVAALQDREVKKLLEDLSVFVCLRIARAVRICRLATYVKQLYLIRVLTQAILSSLHPLCMVLVLTMITVVSFATMMTTLVPAAAMDGDEIEDAVLRYYDSVWTSSVTLLEGMSGAPDWGPNVAFVLFQGVRQGKTTSAAMLMTMLLSFVVLRLGLNGLVTAVFLEQLFNASNEEEDFAARQDLIMEGELLKELDRVFTAAGHGKGALTLAQIQNGLQENPQLWSALHLTSDEVALLFVKVDEDKDGLIDTDEFVYAIFRQRAVSKSADMLAMDYQQEKALQRIFELHHGLRHAMACVQSRLTYLFALLPELEEEIVAVRKGLVEVHDLEKVLQEMGHARQALLRDGQSASLDCDEEAEELSGVANIENIRGSLELNRKLAKLEALAAELQPGSETGLSPEEKGAHHEKHAGGVADSIVQNVQLALQQELAAVRVMAAERRVMAAEQRRTSAEPATT